MLIWIVSLLVVVVLLAIIGLRIYPVFGGKPSEAERKRYGQSPNFNKGVFTYPFPTVMDMGIKNTFLTLRDLIKGNPNGKPKKPLPMAVFDPNAPLEPHQSRITWFGHSALYLELDGKRVLLDPMFGPSPSPFPMFGGKRYSGGLPFELDRLPKIDLVLLSHDHYDHLDFASIRRMKGNIRRFMVPYGVKAHLVRWGIDPQKISEHDWWEEIEFAGLKLACTPARHFSGRSLLSRNRTLWCSWVIRGHNHQVFFSGDSGYGPHFKSIGEKYGPFDLTLMECGQYDPRWAAIHMMPEETVQAHLDVAGKVMIPIHWGAFTLALHDWFDPVERVVKEARTREAAVATPRIGESMLIGNGAYPVASWWR